MDKCQEKCRTCHKMVDGRGHGYCSIRAHEWLKNIEIILSKKREKGEGEEMAEQVIDYMLNSFMGGISAH